MASYWICLILVVVARCGVDGVMRPPRVILGSGGSELEDLRVLFFGESFTTVAVKHMTADVVGGIEQPTSCSTTPLAVKGNMNCLIGYWKILPTLVVPPTYQKWLEVERPECDYTIGFEGCLSEYSAVDQAVGMSANSIVDNNAETVWAQAISPGYDTKLRINLYGRYKVAALSMTIETIPLEFTISLSAGNSPMRDVLRMQQGPCETTSDSICFQFDSTREKVLTAAWEFDSEEEIIADCIFITFHGAVTSGDYMTNYYIIRDMQLLAKLAGDSPIAPTTTLSSPTRRSLRERLELYSSLFVRPMVQLPERGH